MSPELKEYYVLYFNWLDEGAPHMQPFSRNKGIRQNLFAALGLCLEYTKLLDEIQLSYVKAGIHLVRSFCDTTEETLAEYTNGTTHLNTRRLQWVYDRATEV